MVDLEAGSVSAQMIKLGHLMEFDSIVEGVGQAVGLDSPGLDLDGSIASAVLTAKPDETGTNDGPAETIEEHRRFR